MFWLKFLTTVHVLAAVIWVGGAVAIHVLARRTLRRGDSAEICAFSKEINTVAMRLFAPTSLVLLIAGAFLVNEAGYDFSDLFVALGLGGWVISFLVGIGYYGPQHRRLQALLAERGPEDPGVIANVRSAVMVNGVELLILVLVVIDMTWKPGQ